MTEHYIYIDVPHEFELDWDLVPYSQQEDLHPAEHVMTVVTGHPTKFIRNSFAKLSGGDLYRVSFKNEKDQLFFILKTPFKIVNKHLVDDFLSDDELKRKLRNETYNRSPRC